jgi:2-methylcitrate dehydratase PrpD
MPRSDNMTFALAEYIAAFDWSKLPPEVKARIEQVVYDGTGALMAGANPAYSTGRLIAGFAREQGGEPVASVVGHGFKTSPVMAALANGTMGYACDVEPHHPKGILHPIAVMIPTALALGEPGGATGARFLAAIGLGLEVEYRVSISLGPAEQYALGFHPSAVCGCFGATAAAAFLLRLPTEAVVRALGLAGCQASGMMAWETDPTENARPFQMGMAARNGVTAALLAQSGFGGPTAIFDEGHTIFRAFSRDPHPDRLVAGLGADFDGIMELAIKPYPCVAFLHPGLDALLGIVREQRLKLADIKAITLHFPKNGIHCIDDNPLKSHCAQYILPIAVAHDGLQIGDIFVDRRRDEPVVAALAANVSVVSDPALDDLFPDAYASIVEVETQSGEILRRRSDIARGYPEQPLTDAELDEKFCLVAGSVADSTTLDKVAATLRALPRAASVAPLADLLRGPAC